MPIIDFEISFKMVVELLIYCIAHILKIEIL